MYLGYLCCNLESRGSLVNHSESVVMTCRVVHSQPLLQSAVQVFYQEKMAAVAHLVGLEQLPLPTQVWKVHYHATCNNCLQCLDTGRYAGNARRHVRVHTLTTHALWHSYTPSLSISLSTLVERVKRERRGCDLVLKLFVARRHTLCCHKMLVQISFSIMALMNGAIKLPIRGNFVIHEAMSVRGWVSAFTSMYKCMCACRFACVGVCVCSCAFMCV